MNALLAARLICSMPRRAGKNVLQEALIKAEVLRRCARLRLTPEQAEACVATALDAFKARSVGGSGASSGWALTMAARQAKQFARVNA